MKRNNKITWKKGFLKCTFQLFSGKTHVGHLKDSELSRSAIGELNDRRYRFTTHGHLNPKTEIFDLQENQAVGQISFNCWYPKARIQYAGKTSYWKFSNLWETKWRIFGDGNEKIDFRGHAHKGSVISNHSNDLLLLAGLYISNYYWRLSAVIIASLSPILIFVS